MQCKECGQLGPVFYVSNKSRCKECIKKSARESRAANVEHYRAYDAKRYQDDPRVKARHARYQQSEAGKEAGSKAKRKWARLNPIRRGANDIVNNAVRDGKLEKSYACSVCGSEGRIHGHHDDYAKPLDVRWLCSQCHTTWHKENGEGANGK